MQAKLLSTLIIRAVLPRRVLHVTHRAYPTGQRPFTRASVLYSVLTANKLPKDADDTLPGQHDMERPEHAVISAFDLFSIGGDIIDLFQ
jgi:hypothetical protein